MTVKDTIIKFIYRVPRKIRRIYYHRFNRMLFRYYGAKFGKNLQVYNKIYINIEKGASLSIGDNFCLTSGDCYNPLSRNLYGSISLEGINTIVVIGDDTGMSSPCIWAKQSITIGNRVKIGGDVIIMDSDAHSLDYKIRSSREKIDGFSLDRLSAKCAPIVVEDDVLIGTRCIILKGVTIGARSVIAAGSVVTKSIPADCIAGGNPCRVIRYFKKTD